MSEWPRQQNCSEITVFLLIFLRSCAASETACLRDHRDANLRVSLRQTCGHEFETIQKFADAPLTTCPACAQDAAQENIRGGVPLKGGGWYETDFKAGKKKNVAGSRRCRFGGKEAGEEQPGRKR
jgi:putative FmdB family regulatory protein